MPSGLFACQCVCLSICPRDPHRQTESLLFLYQQRPLCQCVCKWAPMRMRCGLTAVSVSYRINCRGQYHQRRLEQQGFCKPGSGYRFATLDHWFAAHSIAHWPSNNSLLVSSGPDKSDRKSSDLWATADGDEGSQYKQIESTQNCLVLQDRDGRKASSTRRGMHTCSGNGVRWPVPEIWAAQSSTHFSCTHRMLDRHLIDTSYCKFVHRCIRSQLRWHLFLCVLYIMWVGPRSL